MIHIPIKIPEIDFDKAIIDQKWKELNHLITKKKFKKGTIVSKPGDTGKVYIINSGRIELYEITENGKKFIYSVLKKGRIFGDFNIEISPIFYSEVIDDAEISVLSTKTFSELLLQEPQLSLKLFKYFFVRLLIAQKKAASIANDNVRTRLIKQLVQLGRPTEASFEGLYTTDKFTHEKLSQMLGVSRQTITAMINQLQKKGLIKRKKKAFLFNKEKLIALTP